MHLHRHPERTYHDLHWCDSVGDRKIRTILHTDVTTTIWFADGKTEIHLANEKVAA